MLLLRVKLISAEYGNVAELVVVILPSETFDTYGELVKLL